MSMKERATGSAGTSELSEDEVVSTSSIQLNEELVMLMMARMRATKCTARRSGERGWLPQVPGDLPRGRSVVEHTHTLGEEGDGPPSLSGTNRQRQPGGAPAQAGAQERSPAEHGQARGGEITTPQKAGPGISRSPTSSQQVPTRAHRIPDSPRQQQQLPPARRPSPRPAKEEELVARAVAVVLSGTACEDDDGRRRLENAAPPCCCCCSPRPPRRRGPPRGRRSRTAPPLSDSLVLTGSRQLSRHPLLVNR